MPSLAARRLTPLGVLVLSLLVERPMHPYEVMQTLRVRRDDRLVKLSAGTVYHTVERLAREGLAAAEGTERAGNRPDRTIYRITDAGRDALGDGLHAMLTSPKPEYPEFPVALSELNNLPAAEAVELLERRTQALRIELASLRASVEVLEERPLPRRYRLDLDYSIVALRAELDWIESTVHDIRSGEIEWSPSEEIHP